VANLSIAQKQMAPKTTIIKTPINAEIIPVPFTIDYDHHHHIARHRRAKAAREGVWRSQRPAGRGPQLVNGLMQKSAGLPASGLLRQIALSIKCFE
jgi:hypothetical protein